MNITHVLLIIFVIAKITGYIDWSWWIVFIPAYVGVIFEIINLIRIDRMKKEYEERWKFK